MAKGEYVRKKTTERAKNINMTSIFIYLSEEEVGEKGELFVVKVFDKKILRLCTKKFKGCCCCFL